MEDGAAPMHDASTLAKQETLGTSASAAGDLSAPAKPLPADVTLRAKVIDHETTPSLPATETGQHPQAPWPERENAGLGEVLPHAGGAKAVGGMDGADGADVDGADVMVGARSSVTNGEAPPVPDTFASWISLTAPHLLPLALAPVVIVSLILWVGGGAFSIGRALLTVFAVLLVRAGIGLLANVRDAALIAPEATAQPDLAQADADDGAGPALSLLARTGVAPQMASVAGLVFIAVGCLCGLPVALAGGPPVWALALITVALVIVYLRIPSLTRYAAVAEVLAALALGPMLALFVARSQRQPMSPLIWEVGWAFALLALAVLLATDLRDLEVHAREGRTTLARLLGPTVTAAACAVCLVVAFVLFLIAALPIGAPHGMLLVGLAAPGAVIAATGVLLARPGVPRERAALEVLRLYSLAALWLAIGLVADGIVRQVLSILLPS